MTIINQSLSNDLVLTDYACGEISLNHYGTIEEGDCYFHSILNGKYWLNSTPLKKKQALVEATRLIDNLNYIGDKADSDQRLQFPRDTDTLVPKGIEYATYELALRLLEGVNVDYEHSSLIVTSRRFANVSTDYNRKGVPEHILAGIPSIKAWSYLKMYLRNASNVRLNRV